MTERKFEFVFNVTKDDGSTETFSDTLTLNVYGERPEVDEVFRSFWNKLADVGEAKLYDFPLFGTVRGFTVVKITEVPSREFKDIPREDLDKVFPEGTRFRIKVRATLDNGTPNEQTLTSIRPDKPTGSAAKLAAWRLISSGGTGWCDTAAMAETVTFAVQVRDTETRVVYDATPKPEASEGEASSETATLTEGEVPTPAPTFPNPGWVSPFTVEVIASRNGFEQGQQVPHYRINEEGQFQKFCLVCDAYENAPQPNTEPQPE